MRKVSSRATSRLWITVAVLAVAAPFVNAQYQGQVNTNKNNSQLRAVGVLEWTGDEEHPKTSRLIPVCVYDGQDLQDASIYMSQPEPLALQSEVEYQLLQDGKPVGFFDISSAAQQQGSWIGLGKWKALPHPKPAPAHVAKIDEDDAQSDVPVLHRKNSSAGSGNGSGNSSGANEPPPDPDRPTLHKGPDASSGNSGDSSGSGTDSGGSAPDPDRPTLHRSPDSSSTGSAASSDSDRPKLNKKSGDDEAYVQDVTTVTDPNRPHLFRGKAEGYGAPVLPTLVGLPADMHQQVAVSDVTNRPVHIWVYSWANPDDEAKMKGDMEDLARAALGLNPPPASAKPTPKRTTTTAHKTAKLAPPPPPAPLLDEQFHVFELAYGSGATMVLSARADVPGGQQKFVTLIGQPDLYGNVAVLLKNVTDAAHLDDTPRMRLVDAVDAMADNRGDLLFELRGATQRQFALYRVLRGDATRIFLSTAESTGTPVTN